ncbi:OsmC family protein [Lysinibacillus sp. LZ02]|uniref:OsmC family protein n=1 Tax=Lysinibacillus sp. LZ02 TaxID=3420668 RepID=UPI003D369729
MVKLIWNEGTNEIANASGVQLNGSKAPDQQGLSPKELLEGAVALCLSITLEKVLERDGVEANLNEIEIDVRASKQAGVENRFTDFHVDVVFPSTLEAAYKKKLLKVIERGCTISNTLVGEVNVAVVEK